LFHLLETMKFAKSQVVFLIFSFVAERASSFSYQPGDRELELRKLEEDAAKNSTVMYDKQAVEAAGNVTSENRFQARKRQACATLYEHHNFIGEFITSYGGVNQVGDGQIPWAWNDRISSVKVTEGCIFKGYEHVGTETQTLITLTSSAPSLNQNERNQNDHLSRWSCNCPQDDLDGLGPFMEQRFEGDISLAATGAEWLELPRFFGSWELCDQECEKHPHCVAWSWVSKDPEDPPGFVNFVNTRLRRQTYGDCIWITGSLKKLSPMAGIISGKRGLWRV